MAPKATVDSQVGKKLNDKATAQCKRILEECKGCFELQVLLLAEIDKYKSAQQGTTTQLLKQYQDDKKAKASGSASSKGIDYSEPPTGELRRGLLYFKKWGPETILHLLGHCDELAREWTIKDTPCFRHNATEILEYCFDVKTGSNPDRVACSDKTELWQRMKRVYLDNGSRLRFIAKHVAQGTLNWSEHGFYKAELVKDNKAGEVKIINKVTGRSTELPSAVVQEDAPNIAEAAIVSNYSQVDAFVSTDVDTYHLVHYFPNQSRMLKRRLSDESTKASAMPQGLLRSTSGRIDAKGHDDSKASLVVKCQEAETPPAKKQQVKTFDAGSPA